MARISMYMSVEEFAKYDDGETARGISEDGRKCVAGALMNVVMHSSEVNDYFEKTAPNLPTYNDGETTYVHYIVKRVKGFGD